MAINPTPRNLRKLKFPGTRTSEFLLGYLESKKWLRCLNDLSWNHIRFKFDFNFEFTIKSFNITAEQAAVFSVNDIRLSKYRFVSAAQWYSISTLEIGLLCKNKAKILKFIDRSIWVQNVTSCYFSMKIIVKKETMDFR